MTRTKKEVSSEKLQYLVAIQGEELRRKAGLIKELEQLLEAQAGQITMYRKNTTGCRGPLCVGAMA